MTSDKYKFIIIIASFGFIQNLLYCHYITFLDSCQWVEERLSSTVGLCFSYNVMNQNHRFNRWF